jgi:hypothetical protein
MADDKQQEPTQRTQPKGKDKATGKPYEPIEIPVPKVSTFRAAIRKVAQPDLGRPRQSGMRGKGSRRPPGAHSSERG